ncbi:MAG TPA: hypothetical protein VMZ90_10535 [Vicinamibacterales bacterium]|nr:hypothetical protein [Vicinamibacterales bacterium]
MNSSVRVLAACIGVAAGIALAAATLQARDRWFPRAPSEQRLLYLTNGRVADRLSLSFDSVVSDVYWIRTVQYFAKERKSQHFSGRYDLLYPLLDLTTTLDPHFVVAYQFGAIFLAEPPPDGAGRLDLAIALLEKGLRVEPRWQYAEALGFLHYWHSHDLLAAAGEFNRAARMPNAPIWLGPLTANMLAKGGDREASITLFTELAKSEEKWVRELAERRLRELQQGEGR